MRRGPSQLTPTRPPRIGPRQPSSFLPGELVLAEVVHDRNEVADRLDVGGRARVEVVADDLLEVEERLGDLEARQTEIVERGARSYLNTVRACPEVPPNDVGRDLDRDLPHHRPVITADATF